MNIEQIKQILADAPNGAIAVGIDGYVDSSAIAHSLSDLRTILAQHEEIERLHSLVIALINCGDSLISTKGKPHFEDYAYADWKGIRTKANATLAASLTREQSK